MSITKKKTKSGVRYLAQPCVGKNRPSKTFDTLSEAARWHEETEKRLRSGLGPAGEIAPGDMLFSEAADRAIKESEKQVSPGQMYLYRFRQASFLKSFGEKATIGAISKPDVTAHLLRRTIDDEVGPSTIKAELAFLRMVYTRAQMWGYEYPSPELTIKRPRQRMKSREEALSRVLKPEELAAILQESRNRPNNIHPFLLFLLYSGMRPTEAAALYWDRLPATEEKATMKARRPIGYVDLERGGFSKVGTKTESRFVPAHPVLIEMLHGMERKGKLVFLADSYINADLPYRFYRKTMETTLKKARLPDGSPLRGDIDFYSFRHTARSAMSVCGLPSEAAETIIGHQDRSFKFTYIHLSDADLIREIAKLKYPGLTPA